MRCATRIEKVLAMMKPPTRIAITANAMRKVEMTSRNCPMASCDSSATSSPAIAS